MQEVNPDNINLNVDQDEEKKNLEENAAESHNVMTVAGASLKAALVHANAKRVYESKKWDEDRDDYDLCPCCNLPVTGKLIPLNSSLKRTYHLGSGFALYFRFIKSCIALLLIVFFISGLYNIITDEQADNCDLSEFATDQSYCVQGYILTYAIPNKRFDKHLLMIQQALNLTTVVVIMFFFHYIRYRFRKTEVQADDDTITPSDYTCAFENIDPETKEKEFRQWLTDIAKKDNIDLKIARVVKTYAITEYIKLKNTEKDLQKKLNNAMKKTGQKTPKEEKFIYDQKNALTAVKEKLTNVKKAGIKRATTLYVTLGTAKESAYLQEKFKSSIFGIILNYIKPSFISTIRDFKGRQIKVIRAPEPTDILWENLGYTTKQKYKNRAITSIITFFLLCISLGIILLLNWAQNVAKDNDGSTSALVQGLSIIISLAIVIINSVLAILIDFLTKYEKHVTYTNYLKGVAQKLSIAQFLNTALISLFVELILADDDGSGKNRLELVNFYGKGGLLEGIFWVFITNALLPPVMTIFDPGYIFKRFRQYLASKAAEDLKMTQAEANLLFEGPAITMPTKYAAMIKMLLLTTFYAPALPFCMIFTIGGLSIYYWAEKYVLLRRSALPNMIGDELADEMIEYAEWAACTFSVGNIIFTYTLKDYYNNYAFDDTSFILAWITFGISLVHIFFPMEYVNKKLFPIKDEVTENDAFVDARPDFDTDYDVENPITHRKAFKELQDIKQKDILKNRRESKFKSEAGTMWQKDILPNIGAGDAKLLFPDKKVEDNGQFAQKDGERDEDEPKAEGEGNQQVEAVIDGGANEDQEDYDDDECDFSDLDKFADQAKTELQMNAKVEGTNLEKMGTYLSNAVENATPANADGVMKMFNLSPGSDREPLKLGSPSSPNEFVVDVPVNVENQYQEREQDIEVVREEQKQEATKNRRRTQEPEVKPFEVEDKANVNVNDKANMNDESEQAIDMIGVTFTPAKEGVSKQISLLDEPGKAKLIPLNVRPLSSESAKLQDKHNFISDTPKTVNNLSEDTENSRIQDQEGNNEQ